VILSPSERAIVEVFFNISGQFKMLNQTPDKSEVVGTINVIENRDKNKNKESDESVNIYKSRQKKLVQEQKEIDSFFILRTNDELIESINPFKKYFGIKPDYNIELDLQMNNEVLTKDDTNNKKDMTMNHKMMMMDEMQDEKQLFQIINQTPLNLKK